MTPAVGTVVNLRSIKGHRWGPITSIDADVDYLEYDGTYFINMIDITFENGPTEKGESGGIIYVVDSATGRRYTVGILEGNHSNTSHAVKATEINRILELTQY